MRSGDQLRSKSNKSLARERRKSLLRPINQPIQGRDFLNTKLNIAARAVIFALAAKAGIAAAQTQTDIHRDAATRNVEAGDTFTMTYSRAFYCNLPDDNNQIVINARGWNNQTGT